MELRPENDPWFINYLKNFNKKSMLHTAKYMHQILVYQMMHTKKYLRKLILQT